LLNILMGSYLGFVVFDSVITYIAIKYLGFAEMWQSRVLFDYYGLALGIIISTAFCFSIGWLLWKVRRLKLVAYAGLSVLALIELAAMVNNVIQISIS